MTRGDLVAAAVLSGNRNFEGRINPQVKANFLASPPLVVAYALAGTVDIDLATEPLGTGKDGQPVYLKDIWPSDAEVAQRRRRDGPPRDVPHALRQRLPVQRNVEPHRHQRRRPVPVGRAEHVHPGAAVSGRR